MKPDHQIWLGCFLFLQHLLPELVVQVFVCTHVDPLSGTKRRERRPHDGSLHYLWSHHDHLYALVSRKHVIQLIIVCEFGTHSLVVGCAHYVDSQGFGERVQAKVLDGHPHCEDPGQELALNAP